MMEIVLGTLVAFGVVMTLVMAGAQWRQLGSRRPPVDAFYPPVSILKPLKGVDPALEENLESFFRLDFPEYEILFGLQDPLDPAAGVVRRVMARHPQTRSRLVVAGDAVGFNPKVNNLAGILPLARHELVLISDSNVAVEPFMLRHMVARISDAGVGLVTSFIRGVDGRSVGGALEGLQLNTFVMGGVAVVNRLPRQVCVVGKSMLLRRGDLERVGGLAELGRYLAEDQVCGEEIRRLGLEVAVCPHPIDNILGEVSLRAFVGRHLRWARIRRRMSPCGYAAEILTNPLPPAAALMILDPGAFSAALAAVTLSTLVLTAVAAERLLQVRRPLHHYPPLVALRSLLVAVLWPVPFFSAKAVWRGRSFRIAGRTRLVPEVPWLSDDPVDLRPEEAVA